MVARIWLCGIACALGCQQDVAKGSTDGPIVFGQACATCHGERGQPAAAMIARLGVRDLTAREFRARVTRDLVEHQVRRGSQNKLMPSFEGALTEEQIAAVAAYVASPGFGQPARAAP